MRVADRAFDQDSIGWPRVAFSLPYQPQNVVTLNLAVSIHFRRLFKATEALISVKQGRWLRLPRMRYPENRPGTFPTPRCGAA